MHFVTHYELVGDPTKQRTQQLMALFQERGSGSGTVAQYVYADGGAGFVISDGSDLDQLHEDAVNYSDYLEFHTRPILAVDEAVPTIVEWMGS